MADHWKPNLFQKLTLQEGRGTKCSTEGSVCEIELRGVLPELKCQITSGTDRSFDYTIGESGALLCDIIDHCLSYMVEGEEAKFVIPLKFNNANAEGDLFWDNFDIAEMDTIAKETNTDSLQVELKFLSVKHRSEIHKLSPEELLKWGQRLKFQGSDLYQQGHTARAFRWYSRALRFVICMSGSPDLSPQLTEHATILKLACYLNLAACQIKHKSWHLVIGNCCKVLAVDAENIKGLYRRAQAYFHQGALDEAQADLLQAQTLDPQNSAVSKLLSQVEDARRSQDAKMAQAMSKMFK